MHRHGLARQPGLLGTGLGFRARLRLCAGFFGTGLGRRPCLRLRICLGLRPCVGKSLGPGSSRLCISLRLGGAGFRVRLGLGGPSLSLCLRKRLSASLGLSAAGLWIDRRSARAR